MTLPPPPAPEQPPRLTAPLTAAPQPQSRPARSLSPRWLAGALLFTVGVAGLSGAGAGLALRLLPSTGTEGDRANGFNFQVGTEQSFPPSDQWPEPARQDGSSDQDLYFEDSVVVRDRYPSDPTAPSPEAPVVDEAPSVAAPAIEEESAFPPPPTPAATRDNPGLEPDITPDDITEAGSTAAEWPAEPADTADAPPLELDSSQPDFTPLPLEPIAPLVTDESPAAEPIEVAPSLEAAPIDSNKIESRPTPIIPIAPPPLDPLE